LTENQLSQIEETTRQNGHKLKN